MTDPESKRRWKAPPTLWSFMAMWGLSVAQPIYDLLGPNPEFFIEHGMGRLDLGLFVAALSALVPLTLTAAVEVFRRLNDRLGSLLQLACLAVLSVALGAQIAGRLRGLPGLLVVAAAVLLGSGLVVACYRWTTVHGVLPLVAAASLLIFPAFFLSAPAIRGLWLPASPVESLHGGTGAPIVILILDELPLASLLDENDSIEAGRFPSFARLARTSSWFRNATSIKASTRASVTSLLTSSRPRASAAPVAAEYPQNLFTALSGTYEMRVVERVTQLCPAELCPPIVAQSEVSPALSRDLALVYLHLVTPEAWRSGLATIDQTWGDFGTAAAGEASRPQTGSDLDPRTEPPHMFRHFIAGMKPRPASTLHYLHLMLPHVPWKYLPSGQEYARPENMSTNPGITAKGARREREWEVVQAYQRHLLQVEFTDRLLGQLLDALEHNGIFDQALLIVTADHGASFVLGVGRRVSYDGINVPLMVKLPGQKEGHIADRHVTLLDVLPTVLSVVELATDWPMAGRSLVSETSTDRQKGARARRVSRARRKTVRRKLAWFPGFADPDGLYRIGPRLELIGTRPGRRLAVADPPLPSIELDRPWFFEEVDPTGPVVPAYIAGRLVAPAERNLARQLAIAVNGRVAGVTRTTGSENAEFSVMVKPTVFTPGSNQVDVYQIVDRPARSLVHLPAAGSRTSRLLSTEAQPLLSLPNGERVRVRPEARRNFRIRRGLRTFFISGALKLGDGEAPLPLLFDGTRALGPIPIDPDRPERPGFQRFKSRLPLPLVPDPGALRVIIVRGASAQRQELKLISDGE